MTVVPVPGLVHRHVVARAVRGLIDAVDGAPVPVPIAGLVARPDDAHAVAYFQRLAHLSPYRRSMTLPTPIAVGPTPAGHYQTDRRLAANPITAFMTSQSLMEGGSGPDHSPLGA